MKPKSDLQLLGIDLVNDKGLKVIWWPHNDLIGPKRHDILADTGQLREERGFSDSRQGEFTANETDPGRCDVDAHQFATQKWILIQRPVVGTEHCEETAL